MRVTNVSIITLTIFLFITSCGTSTSFLLNFEQSHIVTESVDGKIVIANRINFQKGETVGLALTNVGKFKRGDDGLHYLDMDFKVTGPNGKLIVNQQAMLGKEGHRFFEKDIAPLPHATFKTDSSFETGRYTMSIKVYDKVSGGSTSVMEIINLN